MAVNTLSDDEILLTILDMGEESINGLYEIRWALRRNFEVLDGDDFRARQRHVLLGAYRHRLVSVLSTPDWKELHELSASEAEAEISQESGWLPPNSDRERFLVYENTTSGNERCKELYSKLGDRARYVLR